MNISLILATYKRPDILQRTLKSFSNFECASLQWDLWVVDNAEDPSTEKLVKSWADKLPIHYLVEPQAGKNHALNRALPEVKGQLIVLTDDDIIAAPDWLLQLWEGAQRWPMHMVFGGRIIADWPGEVPFWGEHHLMNQSLFALHSLGEKEVSYSGNLLPYGANMAVRKKIFEMGYVFNPSIGPNGSEVYQMGSESEFLNRLKEDGHVAIFLPQAVVKHQIRPEQVQMKWISGRSFRAGYSDGIFSRTTNKEIFSVPLYLWRQLFSAKLLTVFYRMFSNKEKFFEKFVVLNRTRGKIYAQITKRENFNNNYFYSKMADIIKR